MSSGKDRNEGWTRAFVVEESRVEEFVELYKSLGYEVKVEPVKPEDLCKGCSQCYPYLRSKCRIIYIRKKGTGEGGPELEDIEELE